MAAVRAATTAKEDEANPAGPVETMLLGPLHGDPLQGVGPRREDGPLVEAAPVLVVEVAAGQVPAVAAVQVAAVRGPSQVRPLVDQPNELVVGRAVRLGGRGA